MSDVERFALGAGVVLYIFVGVVLLGTVGTDKGKWSVVGVLMILIYFMVLVGYAAMNF